MSLDLFFGLIIGGALVYLYLKLTGYIRKRKYRKYDRTIPDNQLRFIKEAELYKSRPINREAFKVYRIIESYIAQKHPKLRVLAEVSMGAFIRVENKGTKAQQDRARSAFNCKRIDFLIIDEYGAPALAVEYQGGGHYQDDAVIRDMVKKEALRLADIEFFEATKHMERQEIVSNLSAKLKRHIANKGN